MTNENEQFKKKTQLKMLTLKELIEEPKEIKSPDWFDKNKFKKITRIKQVNSNILTLKTWLIILEIIQLVKYLLKKI